MLAFVLTDQAFAAAIRRFGTATTPGEGASYFLGTGVVLWVAWFVSNLGGYLAGNVIPAAWSLEFIVPLCFIAVLVPALDDGPARIAALAAAVAVVVLDRAADAPVAGLRRAHRHRRGRCRGARRPAAGRRRPMSAAGPPQGANSAPSGGSAAAVAASVGAHP